MSFATATHLSRILFHIGQPHDDGGATSAADCLSTTVTAGMNILQTLDLEHWTRSRTRGNCKETVPIGTCDPRKTKRSNVMGGVGCSRRLRFIAGSLVLETRGLWCTFSLTPKRSFTLLPPWHAANCGTNHDTYKKKGQGTKNYAFRKTCLCGVTPAIFVILSSKALVSLVRTQIDHFRCFRQNPPLFDRGQRHGLPKAPFFPKKKWLKTLRRIARR